MKTATFSMLPRNVISPFAPEPGYNPSGDYLLDLASINKNTGVPRGQDSTSTRIETVVSRTQESWTALLLMAGVPVQGSEDPDVELR